MHKIFIIGLLSLYSITSVAKVVESTITYGIGTRNTTVDWNIAGNLQGTGPNVISELIWRDIKSHQVSLGGIWTEGDYFLQKSILEKIKTQTTVKMTDRMNFPDQLIMLERAICLI